MTDLGTLPGGSFSSAFSINNNGQVVGYATTSSGAPHAFLYTGGVMTDLGTLGGPRSFAYGINNNGQIVGAVQTNVPYHAFLYSGGVMTDLGTFPGGSFSFAYGINNTGQVVGCADNQAFLYSGGIMTGLGTLGGGYSGALGINNNSQVVGSAYISSGPEHAFLHSAGTMIDLNSRIPNSGWTLVQASAINDRGYIVGYGINPSGLSHAFLLTPNPHRATATAAVLNGSVGGATITDGGLGYSSPPAVLIQGGGGTGATAIAVVSNGVVVGITITDAGTGYTNAPSIYIYSPLGLQIGLIKAVAPSFSDLLIGTNYQLQVSGDLNNWTNQGSIFMATNPTSIYPQYWNVDNWSQLFFRLQVTP
jgi:probable HAF family extracellular repeat protein